MNLPVTNFCDPLKKEEFDQLNTKIATNIPKFILADRGDCTFVQKVRNMEDAGASLGIVIDNSDEDIENLHMSDDGSGAGIRIPSLLISKKDGNKLKEIIKKV